VIVNKQIGDVAFGAINNRCRPRALNVNRMPCVIGGFLAPWTVPASNRVSSPGPVWLRLQLSERHMNTVHSAIAMTFSKCLWKLLVPGVPVLRSSWHKL